MRKINNPKILVIILFLIGIFINSCKKDDQPDYAGSWYNIEEEEDGTTRTLVNLSESSFEILIQLQNPDDNKFISFAGVKGGLSVSGDIMTLNITHVGFSDFNPETLMPTGKIEWIDSGNEDFEDTLNEILEINKTTLKTKYIVNGNILKLNIDLNENGNYTDDEDLEVELNKL